MATVGVKGLTFSLSLSARTETAGYYRVQNVRKYCINHKAPLSAAISR